MGKGRGRCLAPAIAAAVVVAASTAVAVAQGTGSANKPPVNKLPTPVKAAFLHPELAVQLAIDTSTPAQIVIHGTVCNKGNRDWSVPPAAEVYANLMVDMRHPPLTYVEEGYVTPVHIAKVTTPLKAGGPCFAHDYTEALPNFSRWLKPAVLLYLARNERLVEREIVFMLIRAYGTPQTGTNFPISEDGNPQNNTADVKVKYVEKTP